MPTREAELSTQVAELKAENERLRRQLAETRAQRAEYLAYLETFLPPVELPTEEEMAEQMKHVVPADRLMRDLDERLKKGRQCFPTRPRHLKWG
jgi:chromosome segregation ATPase